MCVKPQEEIALSILPQFAKLTSLGGTRNNGPILAEEKKLYVSKKEVILKDKYQSVQQSDQMTKDTARALFGQISYNPVQQQPDQKTEDVAGSKKSENTADTSTSQGNESFREKTKMQVRSEVDERGRLLQHHRQRVAEIKASQWMDKEDSFGVKPVW